MRNLTPVTISLIIPNFNYGEFLEECINSVSDQTVTPDEIIIIDDCSSDNSLEILSRFENNKQIKIIRNRKNLGIVDNFNKAIKASTSDYIVFVGADNRIKKTFVEEYKKAISKDTEAAILYCDITIFGPRACLLAETTNAKNNNDGSYSWVFPEPSDENIKRLETTNFMHGSSIYRRDWYQKVGGYQDNGIPEDFDLFRRIVFAGGLPVHVNAETLEYRQHSPDQSQTKINLETKIVELLQRNKVLEEEIVRVDSVLKDRDKEIYELNNKLNSLSEKIIGKIKRIIKKIKI